MKSFELGGDRQGPPVGTSEEAEALDEIQRRVLWLATNMIHYANRIRPNPSGVKVGGHQSSSASVVTILTELFFDFMTADDKLSVKPHASPVLHAIHYLLGTLDRRYLTELRAYHGLQAYPSRTKDPDRVDFSTGSVGLGSVAPNFASLVEKLVDIRHGVNATVRKRFISLLGDAELDEGSVWEAVAEPALAGLDNVIWIIDLNRQSLDRVVPGIRVHAFEEMFRANSWTVIEAKYGRQLEDAFRATPGLREALDAMPNEEYQLLLRSTPERIASALGDATPDVDGHELKHLIADLGGHDFDVLRNSLRAADAARGPAVVFAYTIKGWGLNVAGDPMNHSALIGDEEMASLRMSLAVPEDDEWADLGLQSAGGRLARRRAEELQPAPSRVGPHVDVPSDVGGEYRGAISTQQAFGQTLTSILRTAPDVATRIITVSPDVATSTNLAGWINRVGIWEALPHADPFSELGPRLVRWNRGPSGQHIELGISETNLMMLLGQLGLSEELNGQPLFPIGTVYDPFVARALDAYIYGVYAGSRFILVGTPSGVTLAPEGGAHQSVLTPSIGIALPRVTYWEPCFGLEVEWILLAALAALHKGTESESTYLRLSTLPIDQALLPIDDRADLRTQVLSGAYRIRDASKMPGAYAGNMVDIWATGVTVATALKASDSLIADGIFASVVNCVSPGRVYSNWQESVHDSLRHLAPLTGSQQTPVVTVVDGHPSCLSWVGSMLGVRAYPLGVTDFGQSGLPDDLHRQFEIDEASITFAAYVALAS